jgi:hypothetical protein
MRKIMAALVSSSACLFCVQAGAVTVTDIQEAFPTGAPPVGFTVLYDNFNNVAPGTTANSAINTTAFTFATTGSPVPQIVQGSLSGQYAAPQFPGGVDQTPYLTVYGGSTETITLTKGIGSSFGLFIGSLDPLNSISFSDGGSTFLTLSGTQIAEDALPTGIAASGNQTSPTSNAFFIFSDLGGPFNQVALSSGTNSLEVDNIGFLVSDASLTQAVPETSTWIMMILGFLAVGFTAYRRNPRVLPFRFA